MHRLSDNRLSMVGSCVHAPSSLVPLFCATANRNLFDHYFGAEFHIDNRRYVRPISPFEFTWAFGLIDDFTYTLSKPEHVFSADAGIPARTSIWLCDHISDQLYELCDANCQVFDPSEFATSATLCQALVSGAFGARLPSATSWGDTHN